MVTSYIVVVSLRNWPVPHQEKVLLLVTNHFGIEAAELVAAGQIDETLNMALWGLSDTIEGQVSRTTQAQLANASLPKEVVTLGV
jgi:hypothetical protein